MLPKARLEGESLDFRRKARVSRWAGVIDGCLLWLSQKDIEGKCSFYTINGNLLHRILLGSPDGKFIEAIYTREIARRVVEHLQD